jgi:hypothetical protein
MSTGNFTVVSPTNLSLLRTRIHAQLINLTIANFNVDENSTLETIARGYTNAAGPGKGTNTLGNGAGGGGYGAVGSISAGSGAAGGGTYGSALQPIQLGSGGGNGEDKNGGYGGGVVIINITDNFQLNGNVLANGQHGINTSAGFMDGSGGGSGGSIYVVAVNLTGTGFFQAKGGTNGVATAGGEGGFIKSQGPHSIAIVVCSEGLLARTSTLLP